MIFQKYIALFPFTLLNPEIEVSTFNLHCLLWGNAQDWPCSREHVFSDKCLNPCIKLRHSEIIHCVQLCCGVHPVLSSLSSA